MELQSLGTQKMEEDLKASGHKGFTSKHAVFQVQVHYGTYRLISLVMIIYPWVLAKEKEVCGLINNIGSALVTGFKVNKD